MREAEDLVQRVFSKAKKACGDDPLAIARYVAARVAEMSPDDQRLFAEVAEAASSFDPPDKDGHCKLH